MNTEKYLKEIKTKSILSELFILEEWIEKKVPSRLLAYQAKRVREIIEKELEKEVIDNDKRN